uniref:Uncharacterized protein n=1 Tax=Arundo donax TaxID=35708 RepID=A0A0A9G0I2_ARUDO
MMACIVSYMMLIFELFALDILSIEF